MQKEAVLVSLSVDVRWDELMEDIRQLACVIPQKPDLIVAIARGGSIPAVFLGKHLKVESMFSLKVQKQGERRVLLQDVASSLKGKRILVVDDMIETGKGLELVKKHIECQGAQATTACLYVLSTARFMPDYYVKKVEEVRLFPWD